MSDLSVRSGADEAPSSRPLQGKRILVAGVTSQVGLPVARALAAENTVFGLARFAKDSDFERVSALGVTPVRADLSTEDLGDVPGDVDYVLNFAVTKTGEFDYDLAMNAEGAGRLMQRCRRATGFLHCSSAAVYQYAGHKAVTETDPLGDNHRVMMPTYSLAKIAAETVVRFAARSFKVPTVITRLSVPYGDEGGWPWYHLMMMQAGMEIDVHPEKPNRYNLLHEDDYIRQLPRLLELAQVPAVTLNWGGSDPASIEEWCAYLTELTGLEAKLRYGDKAIGSLTLDVSRMHELVGRTKVSWRDGIRRMVATRNPELLTGSA